MEEVKGKIEDLSTKLMIDGKIAKDILDKLEAVEKLLSERISELHEVKGAQQARHAYVYYRSSVFGARIDLRDNLFQIPVSNTNK